MTLGTLLRKTQYDNPRTQYVTIKDFTDNLAVSLVSLRSSVPLFDKKTVANHIFHLSFKKANIPIQLDASEPIMQSWLTGYRTAAPGLHVLSYISTMVTQGNT